MRNKTLTAAVLLALGAGANTPVLAQSIEEVVITAGRLEESIPQELARYGNRVEVVTAEQIERMGFSDVSQTLQMMVPGLHVRPKNGPFDYFNVSLQGSRTGDILWLMDGVRINNRLYNGTTPLDTMPAHMIERIEVLKGGQGIFYGTQSVGGVINIVTRGLQQEADGSLGARVNTNSGYGLDGYYRASAGPVQYAIYGSHDEADGYKPFRDRDFQPSATDRDRSYDVDTFGGKIGFALTDNSLLSLHYQRTKADLDFARPMLNFSTINARTEDILTLKYDLQINDRVGLFLKAYHHEWETRYLRIYNTLDAGGNVTGTLRYVNNNDFWGYRDRGFNGMLKLDLNEGFEYIVGLDQQRFKGSDDVYRIANLEERVNAVFAQVRTTPALFENTTLAIGIRHNDASNLRSKSVWNFSGRHDFTPKLYLQANIGTSFRLPDAEQLFVNEIYDDDNDGIPDDYFTVGNPNLKPEQSRNINLGIGGNLGNVTYELIGFSRRITNLIANYTPLVINGVEGESFSNTNNQVKVDGFELITAVQLTDEFHANLSYTETSAKMKNGNGRQLTDIPEREAKLLLNYDSQTRPFGLSLAANRVGSINDRQSQRRGNYTVWDLAGYYELGGNRQHSLGLRVENLTDKEYSTRVDVGTRDTGGNYLYDNLGMKRTFHAVYNYRF